MNVGSVFAYEPTQSSATNGAARHIAMTTRRGVTAGGFAVGGGVGADTSGMD